MTSKSKEKKKYQILSKLIKLLDYNKKGILIKKKKTIRKNDNEIEN